MFGFNRPFVSSRRYSDYDEDEDEVEVDRDTDEQDDEPEIGDGPHDVDDRGWP